MSHVLPLQVILLNDHFQLSLMRHSSNAANYIYPFYGLVAENEGNFVPY